MLVKDLLVSGLMYLHARHSHSSANEDDVQDIPLRSADTDKHDKRYTSFLAVLPSMGYTIIGGCVILSFLIIYLFHEDDSLNLYSHIRRSNFASSTAMQSNTSLPLQRSPSISFPVMSPVSASFRSVLDELLLLGIRDGKALVQRLTTNPFRIPSNPDDFSCPETNQLFDYPSVVDASRADSFRNGSDGSWIFYQHLRKAGGTGTRMLQCCVYCLIYIKRFL